MNTKQEYKVTIRFKDKSEDKVFNSYNPAPAPMLNMYVFEEVNGARHVITVDKIADIEIKASEENQAL